VARTTGQAAESFGTLVENAGSRPVRVVEQLPHRDVI
jgi:hypothetical protein